MVNSSTSLPVPKLDNLCYGTSRYPESTGWSLLFLQGFFFYQLKTRIHLNLVQRLINNYNNENNIIILHAIYLWVNASIAHNHTKVTIFQSRGPRRHLRHSRSTSTYLLYGLAYTCLLTSADLSSACVAAASLASLSPIARLRGRLCRRLRRWRLAHVDFAAVICRSPPGRLSAGV